MRCPNCGQENTETSAFCLECGTRLKADDPTPGGGQAATAPTGAPTPATTPEEQQHPAPGPATASPPPEVLRPGFPRSADTVLTHLGEFFGLGHGPGYYAVWDLRKAGEPVARFDSSPIGWEAAWRRFHELEREHGIPAWRRATIGQILLHVAIGLVGLGVIQLFVLGYVLEVSGRSVDELSAASSLGVAISVLAGLYAWLLFVFLQGYLALRWAVFLGLLGPGFVAALILALATQPSSTF
jgi:hypothetical protein